MTMHINMLVIFSSVGKPGAMFSLSLYRWRSVVELYSAGVNFFMSGKLGLPAE
jgi:hypothetical protein